MAPVLRAPTEQETAAILAATTPSLFSRLLRRHNPHVPALIHSYHLNIRRASSAIDCGPDCCPSGWLYELTDLSYVLLQSWRWLPFHIGGEHRATINTIVDPATAAILLLEQSGDIVVPQSHSVAEYVDLLSADFTSITLAELHPVIRGLIAAA